MPLLDVRILYWKISPSDRPVTGAPVHIIDAEAMPFAGKKRWGYRLINLASGNFFAALRRERRALSELIIALKPAAILCYYGEVALRLVDTAGHLRVPLIAYFHGDFTYYHDRWYRWSLANRYRDFAAIVVVTQEERAWMRANGVPDHRLHVIPCGVPTSTFLPKDHRGEGEVRFAIASRLASEKGCKESVLAFAEVVSLRTDVALHIYGDGPERSALEDLVKARGLNGLVTFHGHVDEQTLVSELADCDVFLQHSLNREGSSVSIAQAMSCGLPVVVTELGGNVDQVIPGKTGFLVAQHDVAGMARAMAELAGDVVLRRTMGQNGRRRAVEFFDSSTMTDRLQQLIIEISHSRSETRAYQ
jgi:glycosyltransferase involved in cell wall biosynthesis